MNQKTEAKLIPSAESIQLEREKLAKVIQQEEEAGVPFFDRVAAVTDPVITPFVRALIAEGYITKTDRAGCTVLGTCPTCRSRYLFTAIKDGIEAQFCPHCRETQDRAMALADAGERDVH